ncbi:hypothetical protein QTI66_17370 [Variovorax sp. J22R133]|uniref:hypothetical protein n=1 Tax=Variovorax brevis TaxID=3053503 RepID=UPI002577CC38|nr:hypothetical protein [Variovorax sp. J22R133]MDM0113929.1 hypothetical protein [Variovorax sp. J22R133]
MSPRNFPRPPISISGALRRRVNQIAHAQGLKHEVASKARIVDELHRIAEDDSVDDPTAAISAYLKGLEAA